MPILLSSPLLYERYKVKNHHDIEILVGAVIELLSKQFTPGEVLYLRTIIFSFIAFVCCMGYRDTNRQREEFGYLGRLIFGAPPPPRNFLSVGVVKDLIEF